MGPVKEEGRKIQRSEVRGMIFRNGNVKVNCGKDAVQADKGKRWKRKAYGLDKDTKCQIENLKSTDQQGPLTEGKMETPERKERLRALLPILSDIPGHFWKKHCSPSSTKRKEKEIWTYQMFLAK